MTLPLSRVIRIGGRNVHLRLTAATANAERVVFLHGHSGSSRNWTDLATQLSGGHDCAAIDLPGFGLSEPPARYDLPVLADTLAETMAELDGGPVHLVGNSYGGTLALWIAATRPDLVQTLTLISPAVPFLNPRWSLYLRPKLVLSMISGRAGVRRRLSQATSQELVAEALRLCCADPGAVHPARVQEAVEEVQAALSEPWRIDAEAASFRALIFALLRSFIPGRHSLDWLARQVQQPTLVIWGQRDRILDVRVSARLARFLPKARLNVLSGVGHLPHLEAPGRVAAAISGFLTEAQQLVPARAMP
jgi:pimeloyl-ACP methyl ester carboxylesterase